MSEDQALIRNGDGEAGNGILERSNSFFTVKRVVIASLSVATIVIVILLVVLLATRKTGTANQNLHELVKAENIMVHLNKLLEIAYRPENHGSRSVVHGYNQSAEYVIKTLRDNDVDCDIWTQHFLVPIYEEFATPVIQQVSPFEISYQYGVDFQSFRYGGSGKYDITALVQKVDNYGCNLTDFANFEPGSIALIQFPPAGSPNACDVLTQASNAEAVNASAVIIYNDKDRTVLSRARVRGAGWIPGDKLITIPALSASYGFGTTIAELTTQTNVTLRINTDTIIRIVPTFNVICETRNGDPTNTMVVGAHLDSVPEGPGINDNGSGSSSLLEIVLQFFKAKINNQAKVMFCWWGAEEIGLLGSRWFVHELQTKNETVFKNIALALNFDMLGSPNFMPYVHNVSVPGTAPHPDSAVNGSNTITTVFTKFFEMKNHPLKYYSMGGGSDYLPFLQAGIPAGGLATGAGVIKTMEERTIYGGLANAAYDPCYHLPCDTVENINQDALELMASAAAYAIQTLSTQENLKDFLNDPKF